MTIVTLSFVMLLGLVALGGFRSPALAYAPAYTKQHKRLFKN